MNKKRARVSPIFPNLFTTGSLLFGLFSIMTSIQIAAFQGAQILDSNWVHRKFWWAAAFIGIAGLLDLLDGRIARILKSQSNFGFSYDSLSDVVSFGVAPGVLTYVFALMPLGKLGLMSVFLYVVCATLRLARFNVQADTVEKRYFKGLPSPVAAGIILAPILILSDGGISAGEEVRWFYLFFSPFIGLLMVSDVPYWKRLRLSERNPFNLLVFFAIFIAALITHPEVVVFLVVYAYGFGGLMLYIVKQFKKKPEPVETEVEKLP